MEYDTFERDGADLYLSPSTDYQPHNPHHYQFQPNRHLVTLIPIGNILLTTDVKMILWSLQDQLQSSTYTRLLTQETILRLRPTTLRQVMIKMINREPLPPIKVVKEYELNHPSPINVNRPSAMGLDTVYIKQTLREDDYLYTPQNHEDLMALSIYFGYDYVPVVIEL